MVTRPGQLNLGGFRVWRRPHGRRPSSADKNKKLVIFFINSYEVLDSAHDQCGGLVVTQPTANRKVSPRLRDAPLL